MKRLIFPSTIEIRGINPFVLIRRTQAEALKPDWRKPLPVLLRVNGKPAERARTNLMPAGDGGFYLYLNGDVRSAAGAGVGDMVRVELEFDQDYRNGPQHPMPAGFRSALQQDPEAQKNWAALPPSGKKEILRYFARLKSADACARNVAKAVEVLSGKRGRFMARSWRNGRGL